MGITPFPITVVVIKIGTRPITQNWPEISEKLTISLKLKQGRK